ncbi:MAG: transglutaminase family protein [Cellulosilyticaceae bacterium]
MIILRKEQNIKGLWLVLKKAWIQLLGYTFFIGVIGINAYGKDCFDTSDLEKGIVHLKYDITFNEKMKLIIEKEGKKYTYSINPNKQTETFPLQLGNGDYKCSLFENIENSKYRLVTTKIVTVSMEDEQRVYLNAIQNIDWDTTSLPIKKAIELTKNTKDLNTKAEILYRYVVEGYAYDYKKLSMLPTNYLPIINQTYRDKKGICYDFSSLYAAMLRSQGIPTKLVKGYSTNAEGYHAWNEAYDFEAKEWKIIDSTYDLQVIKKKPKVNRFKESKAYQKVNEY